MGSNAAGNPYRPGRGVAPPVLAGRASVLDIAEERLDVLAAGGMPPQDLLLYGPRGNGKTTLLIELDRRARERGLRVEDLPVDALTARERLVRHLQERAGLRRDRLTGVQVAGVGATADRAAPSEEIGELFRAWIGTDEVPLVIVMDEIHALSPEAARPFFDAVQTAKNGSPPFLLLAAGTPDAPRRVREAATYNERGFRKVRVGRLLRPDTITALAEPARMSGRPMSTEAAALLAEEAQDYPYFIQLLGSAAWRAAAETGTGRIGLDAARRGLEASRTEIEYFFSGRYDEARRRKIIPALAPLAALFAKRDGRLDDPALDAGLLEIAAPDSFPLDEVALLNTLRDLGVVWEASPGVWELGIPSFADFVLRRARPEP